MPAVYKEIIQQEAYQGGSLIWEKIVASKIFPTQFIYWMCDGKIVHTVYTGPSPMIAHTLWRTATASEDSGLNAAVEDRFAAVLEEARRLKEARELAAEERRRQDAQMVALPHYGAF